MTMIELQFYINDYEGRLAQILIRERKKLAALARQLYGDFYLRGNMLHAEYQDNLHRLKLIKREISDLIRILREDTKYG